MCDQDDNFIGDFCIERNNVPEKEKAESLSNLFKVAENVTKRLNNQTDIFFTRRKLSGNYPHDYESEKELKPFHTEASKEFYGPQTLSLQYSCLPHGYLGYIDRCWFYHENTVNFWEASNPKNTYICYSLENKVIKIFLSPFSNISNNRQTFITLFISKNSTRVCASFLKLDQIKCTSDFFVDLRNSYTISHPNSSYTTCVTDKNGGIYLGSTDGNIHQVVYKIEEDHLTTCDIYDISTSKLMCLIPSIVYNMREINSIIEIQLDPIHQIIFALDTKSNIIIYKINNFNQRLTRLETLYFTTIESQSSEILKKSNYFAKQKLIKITAILPTESQFIQIVALFDNGYRIYISNAADFNTTQINTTQLQYRVVHLRKPPFDDSSAIKTIFSSYISLETCIICSDYNNTYRLWCFNRSLRCSHESYQESLTIYMLDSPIYSLETRLSLKLFDPIPNVIMSCYNPKNRFSMQLQDFIPFSSYIGVLSEMKILPIINKKSHHILRSVYNLRDYLNSNEFITYTGRSTDIEFNLGCFTMLGKLKKEEEQIISLILEDLWESSYQYQVSFIKNGIYKHNICLKSSDSQYMSLHGDLIDLKLPDCFQEKTKRISFLLYTLIIHVYSSLMFVWESRIICETSKNVWNVSMNCQDSKSMRSLIESLLACVNRVYVYYKSKLNDCSFLPFNTLSDDNSLDFNEDLRLTYNLESLVSFTYQFMFIWTGITAVNCVDFFTKYALLDELKTITFFDMIFKQPHILDVVVWKFLAYIREQPAVFEFLTNNWPSDADYFFPSHFRNIAIANNKLVDCLIHSRDSDLRTQNLDFCLNTYISNPNCLDLRWICNCFDKMNYHPNAISLCLSVYECCLKTHSTLSSTQINYINFTLNRTQEILFMVLNDSLNKYKLASDPHVWGEGCSHGVQFHLKNLKESLNVALDGAREERLSHQLFDWIIKNDWKQSLLTSNSPHLFAFLSDVDFKDISLHELKKARCQYDIYENRKNFLLAAVQLYKIATCSYNFIPTNNEVSLSLDDRANYLHIAEAQVKLSPTSVETASLIRSINEKLTVVDLQKSICEELDTELNRERYKEAQFISELKRLKNAEYQLKNEILSEKVLLDDIVLPCQLTTSYLLIIRHLGPNFVDENHLIRIWNYLIQQVIDIVTSIKGPRAEKATAQFKALLVGFGSTEHCFPLNKLLPDFECRLANTNLGPRWLPNILSELNIKTNDEYVRSLQDLLYTRFIECSNDQNTFIATLYMLESYISLVRHLVGDVTKTALVDGVKSFKDFLESKIASFDLPSANIRKLKAVAYALREILLDAYQKQLNPS